MIMEACKCYTEIIRRIAMDKEAFNKKRTALRKNEPQLKGMAG
jgi:hypothetical protein